MECEKCGAEVDEGAATCPECDEPIAGGAEPVEPPAEEAASDMPAQEAVSEAPAEDEPWADEPAAGVTPVTDADAPSVAGGSGGGRKWLGILVAVLVVAGIAVGGWFAYQNLAGAANSPESAAMAMLKAYAEYDAQGILDTATHASLPADGVKEFEKQAAEAKKRAGGKPGVKDFKVLKTTKDGENQATVEITGQWLTDPTKGTYTKRTEKLTVVKQEGKWLVKLF